MDEDRLAHGLLDQSREGAHPMSILIFILFGLIVGFLARAIMPGRQSMGVLATAVVGMVGSLLGGVIGNLFSGYPLLDIHGAGLIGSVLGALLVLAIMGYTGHRRSYV
jgi:uncharacterized membrane protein YeaQ/YmgE (transglycosylase-associated protein family)